MTDIIPSQQKLDADKSPPQLTKGVKILWAVCEGLAFLFWCYAICKVFVVDLDRYLFESYFPSASWLLDYKFIFILGGLALITLIFGTGNAIALVLFVTFYPLIFIFWKIPRFLFKKQSWSLAIALLNAAISFFKSLRYNLVVVALFLISFAVCLTARNVWLLYIAATILFLLLISAFVQSFIAVFRPPTLSVLYTKLLSTIRNHLASTAKLDSSLKNLPVATLDQRQLKIWSDSLGTTMLFNRGCLFIATKLRGYQQSGVNILLGVLTTLKLIVLTVVCFSAINFAAYKIEATAFDAQSPSYFLFFYYSFNNLLFNSIKEIAANSPLSQSIAMAENFLSLFLVALFASLLITVRSERYSAELDRIIVALEKEGESMEVFMRNEFQVQSIDEALKEMERAKASILQVLLWLTRNAR